MTTAILILYNLFLQLWSNINKGKKFILLLICYIIIFSYLSIEYIFFLETCIMCLGILLSVIASKVIVKKEKYAFLKAFLILLMAVFCYQGTIAIFPMILLTYYAIIEPVSFKEYIKLVIKFALIYGIVMLTNIVFVKILFPSGSRIQIGASGVVLSFDSILKWLKYIVVDSMEVILPFVHIGIIIVTFIFILMAKETAKKKIYKIILYFGIILGSIIICMMPVFVSTGLDLTPRMCSAFGYTIGISLLFMLETAETLEAVHTHTLCFYEIVLIYLIAITIFILNAILYMVLTRQHILVNEADRSVGLKIGEIVNDYEQSTGIKISKAYTVHSNEVQNYLDDNFIHVLSYNQKATASWSAMCLIWSHTHPMEHIGRISIENFLQYYKMVNYEEFLENRVYIDNDILFFYVY